MEIIEKEIYNKPIYEKTIDEMVLRTKCKGGEQRGVIIPLSRVEVIEDLHEKYGKSKTCILRCAVLHGFSILEHENKEQIITIGSLRKNLRYAHNQYIKNFLWKLKITPVENTENKIRRSLVEEKDILAGIGDLSEKLNISYSSFVSLLLSYSFSTNSIKELDDIRRNAEIEKAIFQRSLDDLLETLHGLNSVIVCKKEDLDIKGDDE